MIYYISYYMIHILFVDGLCKPKKVRYLLLYVEEKKTQSVDGFYSFIRQYGYLLTVFLFLFSMIFVALPKKSLEIFRSKFSFGWVPSEQFNFIRFRWMKKSFKSICRIFMAFTTGWCEFIGSRRIPWCFRFAISLSKQFNFQPNPI